jgi:hypothetical protein
VNKQVIKQDDRLLMERVVAIMVALDLRFVQEKSEDGVLVYRLDPWVMNPSTNDPDLIFQQADRRLCNI